MSEESSEPRPLKLKLSKPGEPAAEAAEPERPKSAQLRVRSRAERQEPATGSMSNAAPTENDLAQPAPEPAAAEPTEPEPAATSSRPVLKRRPDPEPVEDAVTPEIPDRAPLQEPPLVPTPEAEPVFISEPEPVFEPEPAQDPEPEPVFKPEPEPEAIPAATGPAEDPHAPPPLPQESASTPIPPKPSLVSTPDPLETAAEKITEAKTGHSPILSIAIIFVLLAILGGAGYGLWYLLASPGEPSDSAEPTSLAEEASLNPIERAQEAIHSLPSSELPELNDAPQGTATPAVTSQAESGNPASAPAATTPVPPNQELVSAVSAYLSSVHIGGMRKTPPAMVIINGKSYLEGTRVDEATGLQFSGIHKGKLAFTDKNGVVYLKSF